MATIKFDEEKIKTAKIMLGNVLPPALHYINLAIIMPSTPNKNSDSKCLPCHTHTLAIDCNSEMGRMYMYINPAWLNQISTEDLRRIFVIEASRIALHHITSRNSNTAYNLPSSDQITRRFTAGQAYITKTPFNKIYEEAGIDALYEAAKAKYYKVTGKEWDVMKETHEKLAYWMIQANNRESMTNGGASNSDDPEENEGESKDAVGKYINDNTRSNGWGENEGVKEQIREATNELESSGALGASSWGTNKGGMMEKILAANKSPVDAMTLIRSFIRNISISSKNPLRSRLNRRYGYKIPGNTHEYTTRILVCGDSSGSMSNSDIADTIALIIDLAKADAMIDFVWWDNTCTLPQHLSKRDARTPEKINVYGRGGTDPSCIFKMLDENHLTRKYSGMIIFSDMIFPEIQKPANFRPSKITWIGTKDGGKPPSWVTPDRFIKLGTWLKCLAKHRGKEFND